MPTAKGLAYQIYLKVPYCFVRMDCIYGPFVTHVSKTVILSFIFFIKFVAFWRCLLLCLLAL